MEGSTLQIYPRCVAASLQAPASSSGSFPYVWCLVTAPAWCWGRDGAPSPWGWGWPMGPACSPAGSKGRVSSQHPKCIQNRQKRGKSIKRLHSQSECGCLGPGPPPAAVGGAGPGGSKPLAGHLHLIVHVCALHLFEGHRSIVCIQTFELDVPEDPGQQEAPQGHGEDEDEGQRQ